MSLDVVHLVLCFSWFLVEHDVLTPCPSFIFGGSIFRHVFVVGMTCNNRDSKTYSRHSFHFFSHVSAELRHSVLSNSTPAPFFPPSLLLTPAPERSNYSSTGRPPRKKVPEDAEMVTSVRPSPRKSSSSSAATAARVANKKGGASGAPAAGAAPAPAPAPATAAASNTSETMSPSTSSSSSLPHGVDPIRLAAGGKGGKGFAAASTTCPLVGDGATAIMGSGAGERVAGDTGEDVVGVKGSFVRPGSESSDDGDVKPYANGGGSGFNPFAAVRRGSHSESRSRSGSVTTATAALSSGSGSGGVFQSRRERDRYSYLAGERGGGRAGAGVEPEEGSSDEEEDDNNDDDEESDGAGAAKLSQVKYGGGHRRPNVINASAASAAGVGGGRQRGGGGGSRRGRRCNSNDGSEDSRAEKRSSAPHRTPDRRLRAAGSSPAG